MGRESIGRRRRVRCTLRCHVLGLRRKPIEARVVGLSDGGMSLVGPLKVEQGDPIRVRLLPHRKAESFEVSGIVWNEGPARNGPAREDFRAVGCLISEPPRAFLRLLASVERRGPPPPPRRIPVVPPRPPEAPEAELDLPRERELGPPPKPEPEENLPTFRIRLKQVGGPRTRSLSVRARSIADAEALARSQLDALVSGSPAWELIEVELAG